MVNETNETKAAELAGMFAGLAFRSAERGSHSVARDYRLHMIDMLHIERAEKAKGAR